MTKLEEVARAIYEREALSLGDKEEDGTWDTLGPEQRNDFFALARAAVEALRTVNDAMLSAGEIAVDDGETYGCRWKAESAYHAILDAILSERE